MSAQLPTPRIDELVSEWKRFGVSALLRQDKERAKNADDTVKLLQELKRVRESQRQGSP